MSRVKRDANATAGAEIKGIYARGGWLGISATQGEGKHETEVTKKGKIAALRYGKRGNWTREKKATTTEKGKRERQFKKGCRRSEISSGGGGEERSQVKVKKKEKRSGKKTKSEQASTSRGFSRQCRCEQAGENRK